MSKDIVYYKFEDTPSYMVALYWMEHDLVCDTVKPESIISTTFGA